MTVEQAIEEVRRVGSLAVAAGGIRYEIRNRNLETTMALAILKERKSEAMALLSGRSEQVPVTDPLQSVLKGRAIELWSDALGERFWLVADEADVVRLGESRGTVYTAAEARRIIRIGDAVTVAEIHRWKRRFDAVVCEPGREGGQP
jgi:hypothetical protein